MIADGAAQVQPTVNAPVLGHFAAGLVDARSLGFVLGFVVERHFDGFAVAADDAAGVAGVGHIEVAAYQEADDCGASGVVTRLQMKEESYVF